MSFVDATLNKQYNNPKSLDSLNKRYKKQTKDLEDASEKSHYLEVYRVLDEKKRRKVCKQKKNQHIC